MEVLQLVGAGIIMGGLARVIMPDTWPFGVLATLALGVAGSLIGGAAASAIAPGDGWGPAILSALSAIICGWMAILVADNVVDRGRSTHADPGGIRNSS